MSAQLKLSNVNTHVVDILGSVKGRDQPVMKMDKAVELVKCLEEEVFINEDYVFFDPFCKAGEILLATALVSTLYKSKSNLVLLDTVYKEMYQSDRYFALAPDERHYNLSLRTFYGNEKSHDKNFTENIKNGDYLSEIDGRLDKEKFNKELKAMLEYIKEKAGNTKKIVAVGNPPYQESDGGFGGSASAIYTYFAKALIDSLGIDEFVLVIPSRWFTSGKGTEEFRNKILKNKYIRLIQHFSYSKQIFPTVDILGGVCFLHYDSNYRGDTLFKCDGSEPKLVNFSENFDIILDDPMGYQLVQNIKKLWKGKFVSDVAWSGKPFGLRTFYFKKKSSLNSNNKHAVPCYSKGRKILYANKKDITKNSNKINEWKVVIPRAYAPGSCKGVRRVTLPKDQYFIIPKGYIASETYNVIKTFKVRTEAENFLGYLKTDFARYFLGLRKVTQDIPKDRWNWVPLMDTKQSWTDKKLSQYFNLTKVEEEHINKKVKEWS